MLPSTLRGKNLYKIIVFQVFGDFLSSAEIVCPQNITCPQFALMEQHFIWPNTTDIPSYCIQFCYECEVTSDISGW